NLVLMLGVIRRLREHSERLSAAGGTEPDPMLSVGEMVDDFSTITAEGEPVSRDMLTADTIVGFFDPLCGLCHEHLPAFIPDAKPAGGRKRALAVVRGSEDDAADMVALLAPTARVVAEQRRGTVARAFHLKAMPAFCRLDENHVIRTVGFEPGKLVTVE